MVLNNPRDYLDYAIRHAKIGNYEVAIQSIDDAIDKEILTNPQTRIEIHKKAGNSFLRLAQKFDTKGKKELARISLFRARLHYQHAKIIVPPTINENWKAYLYSERDDIGLEVFNR